MPLRRTLEPVLLRMARQYPVVTLTGPRQAGKTTVVREVFGGHSYVNLEDPDARERALQDPNGFLQRHPAPVIFDEIQRAPQLLSSIQVAADASNTRGAFILTGSHQTALKSAIGQSLAGRTVVLELLPLSLRELGEHAPRDIDTLLLQGFLPRVYDAHLDPAPAYRSYLQTYVERDVRDLVAVRDLAAFQRFMRLSAGRVGQLFNASALASEVGVSSHTIEHWTSTLEASYIVVRLQPYFENFNKRIVKAPKLYFTEVGLATHLLGLEETSQIARDPLRGGLFENMVIMELFKARLHAGRTPNIYYLRDQHGSEVDAIVARGRDLVPVEIKSSQTFHREMTRKLDLVRQWAGDRVCESHVVYAGSNAQTIGAHHLTPFTQAWTIAADLDHSRVHDAP